MLNEINSKKSLHFNLINHHSIKYIIAAGIPSILFFIIKLIYNLSVNTCITSLLPWHNLPFLAISGACLYFLIVHSTIIQLNNPYQIFLFTTAYSFCAYGILQETSITSLLLFSIFPVIFYTFENMLENHRYIPFILFCTIMLYIQPELGIQITLLLFVLAILALIEKKQLNSGNVLHLISVFLFAFGLSCARTLFYLAPYIDNHKNYKYNGFSYSYLPAIFAGRFFPGVTASRLLSGTSNRMDLYFGILPLLCFFCFFLIKQVTFRKKIIIGIYTVILLMMLEFSPVYYIFNLFHITYHSTLAASFFLIFWMLYISMIAFQNIKRSSRNELLISFLILVVLWSISFLLGKHNFILTALIIIPILGCLYAFLLYKAKTKKGLNLFILLLFICEMSINAYISTNQIYYNPDSSLKTCFTFSKGVSTSSSKLHNKIVSDFSEISITEKSYNTFIANNSLPDEITTTLQNLSSSVKISDKEKKKYCKTFFPDDFQILNAKCKKLGITETLFSSCNYIIKFDDSPKYIITDEGNHVFNVASHNNSEISNCYASFKIALRSKSMNHIFQMDNVSGNLIMLNKNICSGKAKDYIPLMANKNSSTNFQILLYQMNENTYKKLAKCINTNSNKSAKNKSYLLYDYMGIGISLLFAMLFAILLLYDKRQKLYTILYRAKEQSNRIFFTQFLVKKAKKNYIYFLSFLFPFLIFIITMVVGDALPFGSNSVFDSDGTVSTIPAFLDQYYKYQNGNHYLSMNIGFGTDLTLSNSIYILSKLYHFLPLSAVIPALEIMVAFCLGLCGLNMTIYMTHRSKHSPVAAKDFRLLIPASIYSLNAYILASRNYPTWYLVLMLFPLVMLAMDNLMEKDRMFGYSLLLGICILAEIQLAMFICIFLVINFFTYRFSSFKDFLFRGIRFGVASLLGGGCGFIVVYRTLTAYQSSGYSETDGTFPSWGLHGSFWSQWRKLMIFTPTDAASVNAGDISLYCGIFTLILVSVYFLYKKTAIADKLRYLIPIIILSISFNGQVLSYLWNGLHYQSNCPNRYVFLLIFLLSELSYEGLLLLPNLSLRKLQPIIILGIIFFILCDILNSEVMDHSLLLTLFAFVVYVFLHCQFRCNALSMHNFYYIFTLTALLELTCNTIYAASTWNYTALYQYNNYQATQNIYKEMSTSNTYSRSVILAMRSFNQGQYYNTGCINSFGTCLNLGQLTLAQQYGFNATANTIYSEYSSSPLHTAISSCQYLLLPIVTEHPIYDLENYTYLGIWQNKYYVYENPDYCSIGFYCPKEAINKNVYSPIPSFYLDKLSKIYCGNNATIYRYGIINYSTDLSAENSFYFTDSSGKQITPEKGKSILNHLTGSDLRSSQVKMHINYTASEDAYYYLSAYGIASIGKLHPGKNSLTINLPNELVLNDNKYNILLYNKKAANKMLNIIHQNQLTNISISNDTITGTSNYKKNGYTIYSLRYSKNWHAYVDGKEVKTLNPYDTNLLVPTPAGKHTITLKFIPYKLKTCQLITLGFWILLGIIVLFKQFILKQLFRKEKKH